MCQIQPNPMDLTSCGVRMEEEEEDEDWKAAKEVFDNLKTKTPRPVSNSLKMHCEKSILWTLH